MAPRPEQELQYNCKQLSLQKCNHYKIFKTAITSYFLVDDAEVRFLHQLTPLRLLPSLLHTGVNRLILSWYKPIKKIIITICAANHQMQKERV